MLMNLKMIRNSTLKTIWKSQTKKPDADIAWNLFSNCQNGSKMKWQEL